MKQGSLESLVRSNAADKKYNLRQFKNDRHHQVCKKLVEIADDFKDDKGKALPICYIVYFAIGKNAHRIDVFEKGYQAIDETKARKILSWAVMYAEHMGNKKLMRNADLLHALTRYYERISTQTGDFMTKLQGIEKQTKIDNFKAVMALIG